MKTAFEILQSKLTIADTSEFRLIHIPEILDAMEEYKAQLPQQEILYTEEQVRKLIEEANYDGQYLHAKSVTSQMMRDNAEAYSESIIQSLKQPKKD